MKILILTKSADSAGLWNRFRREGHQVSVYFSDPEVKDAMTGIVKRVTLNEGIAEKPDFIWADMVGNGALCDKMKDAGLPVFGGSSFCDKVELERKVGLDFAKNSNILVPLSKTFSTLNEVRHYVASRGKPVVIKCDGNKSASSSHVAESSEEALEYLEFLADSGQEKGMTYLVQEVVKGIEISTEVWVCQGRILYPINSTFKEKKLMEGGKGPNTGAMSSVVFPYLTSSPRIAQETVLKIASSLAKLKFTGCLDVNVIVGEEDHQARFLEFTARAGYDAIYALSAMIEGSLADFFRDLAHGKATRVPLSHTWGAAIRLLIPPAPNEWPDDPEISKKAYSAIKGQPVKIPEDRYIYPIEELGKDKKGRWMTQGIDGTVAEACGIGRNASEAWQGAKSRWEKIKVPSAMGRFDGITRVLEDAKKLRSWGYEVPNPEPANPPGVKP